MRSDRRLASATVLRHLAVCLAAVALVSIAGAARASRVVDLRVGLHRDHTRVVIELDEPSRYHVERSADRGDALAIRLDARGERRRVVSRGPLVGAVTLEPDDGETVARIALREPGLTYSEMLLTGPPRIVIDVRRTAAAAAEPPARDLASTPAANPTTPEGVERAPGPDAAASPPATASARDPFEPPASYRALVAAQSLARPALPQPEQPAPPAPAPSPKEPAAGAPAASTTGTPVPSAPGTPAPNAAGPTAALPPATPNGPPAPHALSAPPQPAATPPALEALLARLRAGLAALGLAPAVLVLALLLLAWLGYRRVILRQTREGALRTAEAPVVFGDAVQREEGTPSREIEAPAEPVEHGLGRPRELEPASVEPPVAEHAALPIVSVRTDPGEVEMQVETGIEVAAEPAAVPPHAAPPGPGWQSLAIPSVEEEPTRTATETLSALEHRVAQLERRIEELLEARERLERYAAAQNEELRVQRAAIARTQRVLRSVVRPEETPAAEAPRPAPSHTE